MLAKEFKEKGRVYKVQTFGTLHFEGITKSLICLNIVPDNCYNITAVSPVLLYPGN